MTAVQYVQALFSHYDAGGFECLKRIHLTEPDTGEIQ